MNYYLSHQQINALFTVLHQADYAVMGPQVRQDTIVFDELYDANQLPWGLRDEQSPGRYRLYPTDLKAAFAWVNGSQAIKSVLFQSKEVLWRSVRDEHGKLHFKSEKIDEKLIALFGVRPCDVAGMLTQDKTFLANRYLDSRYQKRREQLLVIAVNCGYSSDNCFCVSTQTGPKATDGFDLALTEIDNGFVVEYKTQRGRQIIEQLHCDFATQDQLNQANQQIERAIHMQKKRMPKNNSKELRDVLMKQLDHPRWDDVASRCLSCGNCTMVCPTCFCHHETEIPALNQQSSEHAREWDSCFNTQHSYIHGKVIRENIKSRYKQWVIHKLAIWWDQFNASGCVGCGRCITWCPSKIDITEEVAAIVDESNIIKKD